MPKRPEHQGRQITIYQPGAEVGLHVPGGQAIPALIEQVCLSADGGIKYQVCWFNGNTRCESWVYEPSLCSSNTPVQLIGFKS